MNRALASAMALLALPLAATAGGKAISLPADHPYAELEPAPGVDLARARCGTCHSTDYIVMQPPGDAKQWQAVVAKMIKVFGAELNEQEARTIVDYLALAYGPRSDARGGKDSSPAR